ncbi:MAG: pyridoxal phosphate-dependent aminotransferase [Schleiferiaceae bacterium]|nr:pyridoxal phosphate-dependent aminotransferase [Schleiferiaceae bacterium]
MTASKHLSARVRSLNEPLTIGMARKSRELKAEGKDIISLSLGEPDFDVPEFIQEAAHQAITDNHSHYPPVAGIQPLREAIAKKLKRDNDLQYTANQIVVSTGAKQSIANAVLSLVNPGDEVIIPAPYWVTYIEIVKFADGVPVIIPTSIENDFKITAEQLKKYITPKTKLMLFSSPCNPSGATYTKDELGSLAKVIAQKEDFYVIADEIYELIQFGGEHASLAAFPEVYNQTITVNGFSKGFAMTGWRLGYMAAPEWIAQACDKVQGQFTSGASTIVQHAAIAAIEADPSSIKYMVDAFVERMELALSILETIPGLKINRPPGAFYLFPDVSAYFGKKYGDRLIKSANDLAMYLLEEAFVALVPGEAFGSPKCIRISFAASEEELKEAMQRIKTALSQLHD